MIDGALFTRDFLTEGIRDSDYWQSIDNARLAALRASFFSRLEALAARKSANEAQTEEDVVYPVLEALGWTARDVQPNAAAKARTDVPDALLYADAEAKTRAGRLDGWKRFQHGLCLVEAKRWERPLDREGGGEQGTPSSQMLRYLRRADDITKGGLRWGVLTNGRVWRLYFQGAVSVAEEFLEIDLGKALGVAGCDPDLFEKPPAAIPDDAAWRAHVFKLFVAIFSREAFLPEHRGESFHLFARREGERWEAKVAKSLASIVFDDVFPKLAAALVEADPARPAPLTKAYLEDAREGALILLYRLLFVLYAEDRNLLPDEVGAYADVCLTRMRREIADRKRRGVAHGATFRTYWPRLASIFDAIAGGDDALGIPPYNGGLFDVNAAPILKRVQLADAVMADVIFGLGFDAGGGGEPKYINYRDLSVRQLGSVYERLLEYQLADDGGRVVVTLNPFGRKGSGSYYTPDELVSLIIQRAVGPLVAEAQAAFDKATRGKAKSADLAAVDPAVAILDLKICDPAMGSGHFLVTLVDWLTDRTLEAMANAEAAVEGYVSPLVARIAEIRARIVAEAKAHNWPNVEKHLDTRQVVRRMVLKRCIYGVDLNPMAVELAKVALWLHSFTVGAPLSFLDHHLVCGNSLFGERVRTVMDWAYEGHLLINPVVQRARGAAQAMTQIEALTDADISEARHSKSLHDDVKAVTAQLRGLMDLVQGLRWADTSDSARRRAAARLQKGDFGDPVELLSGRLEPPALSAAQRKLMDAPDGKLSATDKKALADAQERAALPAILEAARAAVARERFLHWEATFPGVWKDWESAAPQGGFDAVIGNPPWDRMKFQEVEWFADRRPEIAHATRAADRKRMVAALLASGEPIVADYEAAVARADGSLRVARACGAYPLLSSGDVNLYSLFVERALALVKPTGVVGLLTPSGIASDKSAADFFKTISTGGRLAALLDFENRRGEREPFFADIDSRFKFCALIAGGAQRRFATALCAFFLRGVEELDDPDRAFALAPADFARVNPNTGTAPIFRSRRDADLVKQVYERLPPLVDRRSATPKSVFDVRYTTMFHMTNDSHLFVTRAELERTAYRVVGGRWRRGAEEFAPLYEGKMVQAFDHRAASVVVNPDNLNRPAQPEPATDAQHADPAWTPTPQFWMSNSAWEGAPGLSAAIGFKDITASTNVRTMIAAFIPPSAAGNTLPLILPDLPEGRKSARAKALAAYQDESPLLLANLNALPLDYVARQKVQSTHLNWYIVEQLPIVPPAAYTRRFGPKTAREIVRDEVLALTYTAHDMAPFACDMGHVDPATGEALPPFRWDAADRLRRRAKLDALYFLLMFPSETAADIEALRDVIPYVYSTFPIVRREEEAAHGRYLSRDLALAYLNALVAGDPDANIRLDG